MALKVMSIRVDEEFINQISGYADKHCEGNVSAAIKELVRIGLAPHEAVEEAKGSMAEMMDDYLLRMTKIASRGTKASLANLALSSMYAPFLASAYQIEDKSIAKFCRMNGISTDEQASYEAAFDVMDFGKVLTWDVCDWAWSVGGRMQADQRGVDLQRATKNMEVKSRRKSARTLGEYSDSTWLDMF